MISSPATGHAPPHPSSAAVLVQLLRELPPARLAGLLALMIAGAATEGLGIFTLVPLLALVEDDGGAMATLTAWGWPAALTPTLGGLLAVFLALVLLRCVIAFTLGKAQAAAQHDIVNALSRRYFSGLIRAEWRWLARRHGADHGAALLTHVGMAGSGFGQLMSLAASLVVTAACLVAALLLSWQTTLAAAALAGIIFLSLNVFRRRALVQGDAVRLAQRDLHRQIQGGLAAMRLTKLLANEAGEERAHDAVITAVRDAKLAHMRDALLAQALFQIGGAVLLVAVLGLGVGLWGLTLAVLLPLVLTIARVLPLLSGIMQAWHGWLQAVPSVAEVQALLAETAREAEPRAPAGAPPLMLAKAITLTGVSLRYADRPRAALADVSCSFPARTTTAITGPSGAGKSTLADLVMGLIEPDAGSVAIDGVALTGAARARWRESVAYVQQDAVLFHATVRENLLWGHAGASEADLRRALEMAAAEFALDLPDGLDTSVGDNGALLSGGERQRLCLARALLRRPTLLILDEATSALDAASEAAIRRAVAGLSGQVTCILIAHRSALLDEADRVIELAHGRLVREDERVLAATRR